ncbi:diacylglycerol kinase family protein [Brooklawnia sp.]|uniref:diacylglycerol/lipid kinase family protein n=1 Tax=Brooklawnia sp. TaxID=2699740 RepID=UPI00311E0ED3
MTPVVRRQHVVTIVVNPRSGRGLADRLLPRVRARLQAGLPDSDVRVVRTESYDDARKQARAAVAHSAPAEDGGRPDLLVMMGGDGMANLGLNACAGSHVQLGIIPIGTGDDFARGVGIPRRLGKAVQAIIAGRTKTIDLSLVTGELTGGEQQRYVGSIVSTGYDAKVNHRVNHARIRSYAWALLAEMAELRPLNYRLTIDGEQLDTRAVLVAVGNAGYAGGGVHLCPAADVTDGLLDVMLIGPVSRWTLIRLFPLLFRSGFVRHPAITQLRAREVIVDGDGLVPMADGEDLGTAPLRISCRPGVLTIVVGDDD